LCPKKKTKESGTSSKNIVETGRHRGRNKLAYHEIDNKDDNLCLFYACEVARIMYDQTEIQKLKEKRLPKDKNLRDKKAFLAFLNNPDEQKENAIALCKLSKISQTQVQYGVEDLKKVSQM